MARVTIGTPVRLGNFASTVAVPSQRPLEGDTFISPKWLKMYLCLVPELLRSEVLCFYFMGLLLFCLPIFG